MIKRRILICTLCVLLLAGCHTDQAGPTHSNEVPQVVEEQPDYQPAFNTLALELQGMEQTVNFIVPDSPLWEIVHAIHDEVGDTWAVLYAVNQEDALISRSSGRLMWGTANMYVQLFDGEGNFTQRLDAQTTPMLGRFGEIENPEPVIFRDGMLSFFAGVSFRKNYVFLNTQTGDITRIEADAVAARNNSFLMRSRQSGSYRLELFHSNEKAGEIIVGLPSWYINETGFDPHEPMSLTLRSRSAGSMTRRTISYFIDFNTGTYEVLRQYTLDDMNLPMVISNDRWEIYNVHTGRFEGGAWGEVVAHNKQTGEITFLYDIRAYSAVFSGENLLLISNLRELVLFDLEQMQVVRQLSPREDLPRRIVSGIAYDSENEWFVVAWLSLDDMRVVEETSAFDPHHNDVMISVYTTGGELLRTINTGVEMPFNPSMFSALELELVLDGQGNVLFRQQGWWAESDATFESIRYWE